MEQGTYSVRGILHGRKQPEEHFTSELHARKRAAYLDTVYDSVVVNRHGGQSRYGMRRQTPVRAPDSLALRRLGVSIGRPCAALWTALSQYLRYRGPGAG